MSPIDKNLTQSEAVKGMQSVQPDQPLTPGTESAPLIGPQGGRKYWRSLDELGDTAQFRQFMEREFPKGSTEMLEPSTRRSFLKLMGGSLALAGIGLTSCRWPQEKILPASYQQPGSWPGVPKQFATTMELGGVGTGLLVTSYDGRPIKIEGNPSHPYSGGRSTAWQQAAILDIYDPDRSRAIIERSGGRAAESSLENFKGFVQPLATGLNVSRGDGFAVLSEVSGSPTVAALRERMKAAWPQAEWIEYEPLGDDNEREGSFLVFGRAVRTHHEFANAEVVVSLDSDFMMMHPAALKYTHDYMAARQADRPAPLRSYAVECNHSVTGAQADHRMGVAPSQIGTIACIIAADLFVRQGIALPADYQNMLLSLNNFLNHELGKDPIVQALLADLNAAKGRSIVIAGSQQGPEIHGLVHLINNALGNLGSTVHYTEAPNPVGPAQTKELNRLVKRIGAGEVSTLLIIGGNPLFDAPADIKIAEALGKVANTIHLSLYDNETSQACHWHVNRAHFLEAWGDSRAWDGSVSIVQPLIAPLYEGLSEIELLSLLLDAQPQKGYDLVRATHKGDWGGDFEASWRQALHDGVVQNTSAAAYQPQFINSNFSYTFDLYFKYEPKAGEYDVLFLPSYSLYDGRFGNNGWLLENPDPMTKCTWDNPVLMGIKTAAELGVKHGQIVSIELGGQMLELPVYVLPGHGPGAVSVQLGYGRSAAIRGVNRGGWNTYVLRTSETRFRASGARVSPSARSFHLACVQDHWAIDQIGLEERSRRVAGLIREGTLEDYKSSPNFQERIGEPVPDSAAFGQMFASPVDFAQQKHRWAMAIDLNSCTGCGICTVACQAENNIPVVGRKLVRRGREMHWIRVDRYFSGEPEQAMAVSQPVPCQHCENAPCEQVCPVAATVHDHDGLNVMVYNRCVGTRYCSNNCPYKVRRFNYFNFHKNRGKMTTVEMMGQNPEVTVRSRGVMEKCSFCTQRIQAAKIHSKNEGRDIADGEIVPACAQACPADAIVFGDLQDSSSRISKAFADPRSYAILGEINTRPRVRYQARLRNPNPSLAADYPVSAAKAAEEAEGMKAEEHSGEPAMAGSEGGH